MRKRPSVSSRPANVATVPRDTMVCPRITGSRKLQSGRAGAGVLALGEHDVDARPVGPEHAGSRACRGERGRADSDTARRRGTRPPRPIRLSDGFGRDGLDEGPLAQRVGRQQRHRTASRSRRMAAGAGDEDAAAGRPATVARECDVAGVVDARIADQVAERRRPVERRRVVDPDDRRELAVAVSEDAEAPGPACDVALKITSPASFMDGRKERRARQVAARRIGGGVADRERRPCAARGGPPDECLARGARSRCGR